VIRQFFVLSLLAVLVAACRTGERPQAPPILQPGAPGEPTREVSAGQAADISGASSTAADVRFMQGMIAHHAQALEMTALVPDRTGREDMRLLARRIEASQSDEIAMMRTWLEARGEAVPDPHAHHAHGSHDMPGMASPEQLEALRGLKGEAFDRLFLELMIRHHDGALIMVRQLMATPGAGQDPDIFAFVSDVEADQDMEIRRMAGMLKELQQ
jgi:uncharacterized protein (DUF305 family)